MASMAAAASVINYGDEGILDRNEDEIERQRLIDDLFVDTGSVPDFEGFPASERVESSNSEDDSASEADTKSHDEIQIGGLDDADVAAAYQTDPNLPVSGRDETGDKISGPGDETNDKTAATAGDERDGVDR